MNHDELLRYRPTKNHLISVKRILRDSGVAADSLPNEWYEVLLAATYKWIHTTTEGKEVVLNRLLSFDSRKGDSDREYYISDLVVKPDDVVFYQGATVGGKACRLSDLGSAKVSVDTCKECGVSAHCLVDGLCNYCKSFNENAAIRANANTDACFDCTVEKCSNNPKRSYA